MYEDEIRALQTLNLGSIIDISRKFVPEQYKNCPWTIPNLNHGTALLTTDEQMCCYMAAYGGMHQAKIKEALQSIQSQIFQNNDIQIVDWGCGQGLATICFLDYLNERHVQCNVNKVVLIEPSSNALNRAVLHVNAYLNDEHKIAPIAKYIDDVTKDDIASQQSVTLHFLSNILDIKEIDLKKLAEKVGKDITGQHYFFCIGPLNSGNNRIDAFYEYFNAPETLLDEKHGKGDGCPYTAKYKVFKLENNEFNLIAVEYYPPVQFHAAYQLDCVQNALTNSQYADKIGLLNNYLSNFEVAAPFDIGASIYDDVHPIFAILNNIVTRGLPTKASPFLEQAFEEFGNKQQNNEFIIQYDAKDLSADDLFLALHTIDSRFTLDRESYNDRILDSDLEKRYITEVSPKVFQQILQPQRSLQSITKDENHYAQRVDFAFEYPYPTNNIKGFVIELDGYPYHEGEQKIADEQRVKDLKHSYWHCERVKDFAISNTSFKCMQSDYVKKLGYAFKKPFDDNWKKSLQLTLSPIAIARVQKTILEALMIDKLDINANEWNVMVIERDVPCAALAFADLKDMFNRLVALSKEYAELKFPKVNLEIISTQEFVNSPLHNGITPNIEISNRQRNKQYDLVIDVSVLRRAGIENITFSEFNCKNNCYFNIRSAHYKRSERHIYTSDTINYKSLVEKTTQGTYDDIETEKKNLQYFLQLLFRKVDFRPGQLPILSRALQNKSVIGLLPTGGGKSLTYQLAAMLQPGVTIVVDPLKSLMKDQYDGLVRAGIDACMYINSDSNSRSAKEQAEEREKKAKMMEDSQLQFIFLSPERLCIYSFRERLRNMKELGVYFSYGVIDEVHCVSEWGHDFRISYLHLGRNLYQYVLPKQTEDRRHISLFGLTATASFDVLADVERELSGNGAFPLDSESVVRYENTNRLELQYRIVEINVPEENPMTHREPNQFDVFNEKKEVTDDVLRQFNSWLTELQTAESIDRIKRKFIAREQIQDENITTEISNRDISSSISEKWFAGQSPFTESSIVFCPHIGGAIGITQIAANIQNNLHCSIGTFGGGGGSANQDDFINNKLPIMVATKAFGMGVDKPNVRYTLHTNFPSSLEALVQEAGRAGRDGKMALATILYCPQIVVERFKDPITNQWENIKVDYTADYGVQKYFYEGSFIGIDFEKKVMHYFMDLAASQFMDELNHIEIGERKKIVIPYKYPSTESSSLNQILLQQYLPTIDQVASRDTANKYAEIISRAVYRMCCIGLITDFTQDYKNESLSIVAIKRENGGYFECLKQFLLQYYSETKAADMVEAAKKHDGRNEIQKCIEYLTEFIYSNIAIKRKQAMQDMETFCKDGIHSSDWKAVNEDLKDTIYYYFNSKYARHNYEVNAKPYSLLDDTSKDNDNLQNASTKWNLLDKYLRVIEDAQIEPGGVPLDNVKHLQGAVRLIRRSPVTSEESSSVLLMLNVFCLFYLGTNENEALEAELQKDYFEGYQLFYDKATDKNTFYQNINRFNDYLIENTKAEEVKLAEWNLLAELPLHTKWLEQFKEKYIK